MKFHMEYYTFSQLIQSGFNLSDKMESAVQVQQQRFNDLFQDPEFMYRKTLCIDIMSTIITKVEVQDLKELDQLAKEKRFKDNYILVKVAPERSSNHQLEDQNEE